MKKLVLSIVLIGSLMFLVNIGWCKSAPQFACEVLADTLVEEMIIPLENISPPKEGEEVYFIVEDMPKFIGDGKSEFRTFIAQNLIYPPKAAEKGISGTVFVQFVVNQKGKVVDVAVVRGVHPLLDKEAIRVVKKSPDWTPGYQKGKPVKVQFTFPIAFSLTGPDSSEEE